MSVPPESYVPSPHGGRAGQLDRCLSDLLSQAPELEAAAVVSFDGLAMASALPVGMDEDRVAAMSAALLSLGEKAAQGLGRGDLSQVYIEGEYGTVFLVSALDEAVLVAVAAKAGKTGLMLYEVRRSAGVVGQILQQDGAFSRHYDEPVQPEQVVAVAEVLDPPYLTDAEEPVQPEYQAPQSYGVSESESQPTAEAGQPEGSDSQDGYQPAAYQPAADAQAEAYQPTADAVPAGEAESETYHPAEPAAAVEPEAYQPAATAGTEPEPETQATAEPEPETTATAEPEPEPETETERPFQGWSAPQQSSIVMTADQVGDTHEHYFQDAMQQSPDRPAEEHEDDPEPVLTSTTTAPAGVWSPYTPQQQSAPSSS